MNNVKLPHLPNDLDNLHNFHRYSLILCHSAISHICMLSYNKLVFLSNLSISHELFSVEIKSKCQNHFSNTICIFSLYICDDILHHDFILPFWLSITGISCHDDCVNLYISLPSNNIWSQSAIAIQRSHTEVQWNCFPQ